MSNVIFTADKRDELRRAYINAIVAGDKQFKWEGNYYIVAYARYVLEYLDQRFGVTSYAAEVIADASGKWCGNSLRFMTREEAENYVGDLSRRWTSVSNARVVTTTDSVNYAWVQGNLYSLKP